MAGTHSYFYPNTVVLGWIIRHTIKRKRTKLKQKINWALEDLLFQEMDVERGVAKTTAAESKEEIWVSFQRCHQMVIEKFQILSHYWDIVPKRVRFNANVSTISCYMRQPVPLSMFRYLSHHSVPLSPRTRNSSEDVLAHMMSLFRVPD